MYTMMQVCSETNMTYQTLKYYCNEGLIPNVKRDKNNRRIFDEHDVKWIKDLVCLKKCNFSIHEMKVYLDLCLQGQSTISQRQQMLTQKREELLKSISELNDSVSYIDWKQGFYNDVLSGKIPYKSNLIKID
ncbi:MAG TPA: MerR family transcriptional regulator [Candidatus Anaerotignum merdipullorum]|nr:MerR family transcriptional regulator [Candidatus Anaerotignum merdipullorum]